MIRNPSTKKTDDLQADLSNTERHELVPAYQLPGSDHSEIKSDVKSHDGTKKDPKTPDNISAGSVVVYVLIGVISITGRVHAATKTTIPSKHSVSNA